jgi:hypothetical protein
MFDGSAVLGALLALAELASPWAILVLPLSIAVVVKVHDVVAGALATTTAPPPGGDDAADED